MESNKFTENKLGNWARIESIIEWADMTAGYFARYIGLPRAENLYQIKRGNNGISLKLSRMIIEKFPQINQMWLLMGEGEMFNSSDSTSATKPLFNVGVEENIRNIDSLEVSEQLILPQNVECDLAMLYLGRAMSYVTPTNSVILLKRILPEMIIPGDECVIVTKKVVLLRIVNIEEEQGNTRKLRLKAIDSAIFGDILIDFEEIESVYKVKGKILINN